MRWGVAVVGAMELNAQQTTELCQHARCALVSDWQQAVHDASLLHAVHAAGGFLPSPSPSTPKVQPWKVFVQQLFGSHLDQLQSPAHLALRQVAPEELQRAAEVRQTLLHVTTLK